MTFEQALTEIYRLEPDHPDEAVCAALLNELEGRLWRDLYGRAGTLQTLDPEDTTTGLLCGEPEAASLYPAWVVSRLALLHGEEERYRQFNTIYAEALETVRRAASRAGPRPFGTWKHG